MEYTLINLITVLIGVAFVYNGYRLVNSGREDVSIFFMSIFVGIGLIAVGAFPNIFDVIATILGLEWKARAILVVSNLTLFILITYLVNRVSKLHGHVSALNEELSLLRTRVNQDDE